MDTATQEKVVADGGQTPTPETPPAPQPDPAVVELQRKVEELSKQTADKDKYITDLKATVETLETRITQREPQAKQVALDGDTQTEAKQILEKAQIDPEAAGIELAALIKKTNDATQQSILKNIQDNLQPAIENNVYAAEVKVKHKDLLDFFGEDVLSMKVSQKIQSGSAKTFKEAVDSVVKEYRMKLDSVKPNAPATPPPPSSQGEDGSNKTPEPPKPKKVETQEDEVARRNAERAKRGL